jgi:hypothetical protein
MGPTGVGRETVGRHRPGLPTPPACRHPRFSLPVPGVAPAAPPRWGFRSAGVAPLRRRSVAGGSAGDDVVGPACVAARGVGAPVQGRRVPVAPGTPSPTPPPQWRRARGPQPPGARQVPARICAAACQQRRGRAPAGAAVGGPLACAGRGTCLEPHDRYTPRAAAHQPRPASGDVSHVRRRDAETRAACAGRQHNTIWPLPGWACR